MRNTTCGWSRRDGHRRSAHTEHVMTVEGDNGAASILIAEDDLCIRESREMLLRDG
jgi:hypothetical protein